MFYFGSICDSTKEINRMYDSQEHKNYFELRQNNPKQYDSIENNAFYSLEDNHITNKIMLSKNFQQQVDKLMSKPLTIGTLKSVVSPVMKQFHLEDVKIKKTTHKSGDSFFHLKKNTIYLNQYLFKDAEDLNNHNAFEEILFFFYHELAHAYTNTYISEISGHDTNYVYSIAKIYSYVSKKDFSEFLSYIVNLDDYQNTSLWSDDFDHISISYYSNAEVEQLIKHCKKEYKSKKTRKLTCKPNSTSFLGLKKFDYFINIGDNKGVDLSFKVLKVDKDQNMVVSFCNTSYVYFSLEKHKRLNKAV